MIRFGQRSPDEERERDRFLSALIRLEAKLESKTGDVECDRYELCKLLPTIDEAVLREKLFQLDSPPEITVGDLAMRILAATGNAGDIEAALARGISPHSDGTHPKTTPLIEAALSGNLETAAPLVNALKAGGLSAELRATDELGRTALDIAYLRRDRRMVRLLSPFFWENLLNRIWKPLRHGMVPG